MNRYKIAILCYHGITDNVPNHLEDPDGLHVDKRRFAEHMGYLVRRWRPMALRELVECIERGESPPRYSVVVTFDDGFRNVFQHAVPLLEKAQIPATVFVVTEHVSTGEWLWPDRLAHAVAHMPESTIALGESEEEVLSVKDGERHASLERLRRLCKSLASDARERVLKRVFEAAGTTFRRENESHHDVMGWDELSVLQQAGIEIGCHSASHPSLTQERKGSVRLEVTGAKRVMEMRLGYGVQAFAYPNGDYDDMVVELVKEAGFRCALTTDPGLNTTSSDRYRLRRTLVGQNDDLWALKASLCGLRVLTTWLAKRVRRTWHE